MTFEQITKMLDAGFTKDEIMQLAGSAPTVSQQEPAAQPEAPAEPEPESIPEAANIESAALAESPELNNRLTAIEKNMADLLKAVQVGNLKSDIMPAAAAVDNSEALADRSILQIIRPERHERGAI